MIVLDTHTFVWWMNQPADLSRDARTACEDARRAWHSSHHMLGNRTSLRVGRLLDRVDIRAWLNDAFAVRLNQLLPLTPDIAATAAILPPAIGRDPADRLIVATAIEYGAPLVTKDERILRAHVVPTIW